MKQALLLSLVVIYLIFIALWVRYAKLAKDSAKDGNESKKPSIFDCAAGFVINFLDTLGIGSFATTSSVFKLKKVVPDELIPGTMNVGHAVPTVAEALIYISILQVDTTTLVSMIAASVLGAWLGAGVVSHWSRRRIQIGLGSILVIAAGLMFMSQMSLLPGGGDALALSGSKLWLGLVGNFVLGALMTLGIGLYAPCMILVSLLGMNPQAAFPIMMGSCAFLMPVAGLRFIKSGRYSLKSALGLSIGGVPGVLIAAFLVKSLPLSAVRWLVIAVVLYTSYMLIRSAIIEAKRKSSSTQ